MKDLSKSIMDKRTESVIENFSTEESPGPDGFTGECYQTFKELPSIFLQFLKKKKKRKRRKNLDTKARGGHYQGRQLQVRVPDE